MTENITIKKAVDRFDYAQCVQIRTSVFVHRQSVPPAREIDEFENESHHYIALYNGEAAGAVRWRKSQKDPTTAKIERLATLPDFRGNGIGKALMHFIIDDIKSDKTIDRIILGSQDHAIPFYEAMGFKICSDGYLDGGTIPHHNMELTLAA